ncbi:hypothetical protein BCR42DRAFT_424823 [Absidia repens]|uniref:sn-1-specific diacylglycerol lipase n=1 Tax=Absidia repens TaxID=90262 RepID=A0A1X2I325_9FUNG|nr:hypothetical protein BCR42DRAFT_424823 [Absidia repens]
MPSILSTVTHQPSHFASADNVFSDRQLPRHHHPSTSGHQDNVLSIQRRFSLPDLTKHREEQAREKNSLPMGKLQIDLLNVRSDVDVKNPQIRIRLGSRTYCSSRSKDVDGNWNEGFVFTISYHNQLFDTIEFDLYDRRNGWRSKTKHIGKAKLKISELKNRHDVYLTFLPMYEYHTRRYLPAHIPLPHNFLRSHIPSLSSLPSLPKFNSTNRDLDPPQRYQQHPSHSKNSMTPYIGSIQIRVRYTFQRPPDTCDSPIPVYLPFNITNEMNSSSINPLHLIGAHHSQNSLVAASSRHSSCQPSGRTSSIHLSTNSETDSLNSSFSSSSSVDSVVLSPQTVIHQKYDKNDDRHEFHDAIEPDIIHVTHIHHVQRQLEKQHPHLHVDDDKNDVQRNGSMRTISSVPTASHRTRSMMSSTSPSTSTPPSPPAPITSDHFGFSQCDGDHRKNKLLLTRVTRKDISTTTIATATTDNMKTRSTLWNDKDSAITDTSSIRSHNFGDKNFAFRWINESFEEVALSHPNLDRMIGMVVSPQTRTLVRAVVKMMNAFGQGFKVTTIQLFYSLSMLQKFYTDIPRSPPAGKVTDLQFLDEARYYLGHAIIAYGWRGISYLGDYANFLKDVMKTKSNKLAIVRFLKIPQEDLLGYEYGLRKGAVFQPSYFISIDRGHEAVVLGIRGTWSLYDVITDLVCDYKPWKGGLVHCGVLASAQWLFTRIVPQIFHHIHEHSKQRTVPYDIKSFIITGHSLGAGTASILTMMIVDHLDELRQLSNNPNFKVHCYGYAPVASVSLDLSEQYKDHIDSFVCQDDLVARLSYGTASCAKELVMDALIAADGLGGISKVNKDETTRQACFEIIQNRRQEIFQKSEPRYPLLYVPGKVFQFRRRSANNGGKTNFKPRHYSKRHSASTSQSEPILPNGNEDVAFTLHPCSALLSEEVLISKTCLEDHMLVTYLKAFQTARQDCMRANGMRTKNNNQHVQPLMVDSSISNIRV